MKALPDPGASPLTRSAARLVLLVLLLVAPAGRLLAQQQSAPEQQPLFPTVPAPESAALWKFETIPVGEYTGTPDISVPLLSATGTSLSLPVTLSYHGSGIRVEDRASWVGLGWALSAGGRITRSVQGLPDDFYIPGADPRIGYLYYGDSLYANGGSFWADPSSNPTLVQSQIPSLSINFVFDTEPDVFTVSLPGTSGTFYLPPLGRGGAGDSIVTSPLSVLKIRPRFGWYYPSPTGSWTRETARDPKGYITGWTVTDANGIEYDFGLEDDLSRQASACGRYAEMSTRPEDPQECRFVEYHVDTCEGGFIGGDVDRAYTSYPSCAHVFEVGRQNVIESWLLREVRNPRTGEKISLSYSEKRNAIYYYHSLGGRSHYASTGYTVKATRRLREIRTDRMRVLFETASEPDRLDAPLVYARATTENNRYTISWDIRQQEYALRGISARDLASDSLLVNWRFHYGYFNDSLGVPAGHLYRAGQADPWKRLRLDSLYRADAKNKKLMPGHAFAYYEDVAPYAYRSSSGVMVTTGARVTLPPYAVDDLPYCLSSCGGEVPGFSEASDHWGFFNGAWENLSIWDPADIEPNWQRKRPSLEHALGGTLRQITYPTGGVTRLSYGLHQWKSVNGWSIAELNRRLAANRQETFALASYPEADTVLTGGGLRIEEIATYADPASAEAPQRVRYAYEGGVLTAFPVYFSPLIVDSTKLLADQSDQTEYLRYSNPSVPLGLLSGSPVGYARVSLYRGTATGSGAREVVTFDTTYTGRITNKPNSHVSAAGAGYLLVDYDYAGFGNLATLGTHHVCNNVVGGRLSNDVSRCEIRSARLDSVLLDGSYTFWNFGGRTSPGWLFGREQKRQYFSAQNRLLREVVTTYTDDDPSRRYAPLRAISFAYLGIPDLSAAPHNPVNPYCWSRSFWVKYELARPWTHVRSVVTRSFE